MKRIVTAALVVLLGGFVFAQSAERIEAIVKTETLSVGQACYLAGTASGKVAATASFENAFSAFNELKIFKGKSAQDAIRLDEFANLALRELGVKKNLWYLAGKTNHYAFRSVVQMGLVKNTAPPSMQLSGREAIRIFNDLLQQGE